MLNTPDTFLNGQILATSRQIDPVQPCLGANITYFQAAFPPFCGIWSDFVLYMLRIPPAGQAAHPEQDVSGEAQERLAGQLRLPDQPRLALHAQLAAASHEVGRVMPFVRAYRRAPLGVLGQELERRLALRLAGSKGGCDIDHQAVAILINRWLM